MTAEEQVWAKEQLELMLFELFVNIKAVNSSMFPSYICNCNVPMFTAWREVYLRILEMDKSDGH